MDSANFPKRSPVVEYMKLEYSLLGHFRLSFLNRWTLLAKHVCNFYTIFITEENNGLWSVHNGKRTRSTNIDESA